MVWKEDGKPCVKELKRDNNMFHKLFGQRHPSLTDFLEITSRKSCNCPVTFITHKRLTVYSPVANNALKTEGETGSTFSVIIYRGYYMAAREYEFYLLVLKVSLTRSLPSLVRDTFSTRR